MTWQEWLQEDLQSDVPITALLPLVPLMLGAMYTLATNTKATSRSSDDDWFLNGKMHR